MSYKTDKGAIAVIREQKGKTDDDDELFWLR